MPRTDVFIFAEADGNSPFLIWLDKQPQKVQNKCIAFIERLQEYGYDLRRPQAEYLRDGIYELRVNRQGISYRILYFLFENQAIISHGFIKKQRKVPENEIEIALKSKEKFLENPKKHTYKE